MEKISRTQKKKAAMALQKLGEQLVHLSDAQFSVLELPGELKDAVALARRIKQHEARRRQLQYIGRLMRQFDPGIIQGAIDNLTAGENQRRRKFKLVEKWRDELVSGDDQRFRWLVENYPSVDPQELRLLVKNARQDHHGKGLRKAGRRLFRYLSRLD
jgi:ribosome-associated protein